MRRIGLGLVVFLIAAVYVWRLAGDVLNLGIDEGIYLEGGRRVAQGQVPYRDFQAVTGPLTFWIEGGLARLSHGNLRVMRLPMVLDVAVLTWCVYRISAAFAGGLFPFGLSLVYLIYTSRLNRLVVNHRWDSAALAAVAIVAVLAAERRHSRWLWFTAGLFAALAAWATPTVALAAVVLGLWALCAGRWPAIAFLGGGLLVTAVLQGALAREGALLRMAEAMRWAQLHWAPANRMPYGVVLLSGSGLSGVAALYRLALQLHYAVPAIVAPAALAGWAWRFWHREDKDRFRVAAVLAVSVALLVSAWPRWSSTQLAFTAAPAFAMAGVCLGRSLAPGWRKPAFTLLAIFLLLPPIRQAADSPALHYFGTRAGTVRGTGDDEAFLRQLEDRVPAGSSLFVFPYLPALYYYLDAGNPVRYSFLQPGMMTAIDEGRAIGDLVRSPPARVVNLELPPEFIRLIWPASDPARLQMEGLQAYLSQNYRPAAVIEGRWGTARVLERTAP